MTPQYLRALQAEIQGNEACAPFITPSQPKVDLAVARANDQAIADLLNEAGWGARSRAVPCHVIKKLLIKRGRWRGIVLAAGNSEHAAVEAAYAAVALAEDPRMDADLLDEAATPLVNALLGSGLINDEDRELMLALCRVESAVTAEEVGRAIRGPWGDEQGEPS